MSALDHTLIYEARKFITAENVHRVNTWIFCYETTDPASSRHNRFEGILREFVATKRLTIDARMHSKVATDLGIKLRKASSA